MADDTTNTGPSDGNPIWSHYPMYAATIRTAAASNDVDAMRTVAEQAKAWLDGSGNVAAALEVLKAEIAKHEAKGT